MADGVDLSLSGLASGFDWKSLVEQLGQAQRAPETQWRAQQNKLLQRNSAFANLKTQLAALQTSVTALKEAGLYESRQAKVSDASIASASAAAGTPSGTFTFDIQQLATTAKLAGTINVGRALSPTSDVSTLTLDSAGFATAITAGTFTVNGQQVTLATSDSLQGVFDKIAAATGNQVTGSYNPATDKISLASSSEIVLGSATDTSNFLQAARLTNNGTGAVTSSLSLGSIRLSASLASAGFATALGDGGSGAGEFKINGVSIQFNASTDSVASVLERINSSAAGVTATYDAITDRFQLTNKTTGDIGVAVADVTGNFLAATGLAGGTLARGKNLIYTLNDGDPLISQSNTITDASSGLTGLSVTALKENASVTVTVGSDTDKIKSAIQSFVEAYNKVQSFIDSQTASSTDSKGKVNAGILAEDSQASEISSGLRRTVFVTASGLTGTITRLADLGYQTSGYNNSLSLSDADQFNKALAQKLPDIKEFFTAATNGLAAQLDGLLTRTIGENGSLQAHQDTLTKQSTDIDKQIAALEKTIQADQERMTRQFIAMETAQANLTQQLQYLTRSFPA